MATSESRQSVHATANSLVKGSNQARLLSVIILAVVQVIVFVLGGCAASGPVLIRGELASPEVIALTAESVAIVELTRAEDGRVIAEQRLPLADRKVPVPFELQAQRAAFEGVANYLVRGAIVLEGRTRWFSDPVEMRAQPGPINVGTLMLKPYVPVAFSSPLVCGDRRASVGVGRSGQREFLQLTVEGERFELYESITASGSRYDAVDDARTYVWFKGQRATLTVRGVTYPECTGAN
jgi:uncharacterized lipoprotein YbaY